MASGRETNLKKQVSEELWLLYYNQSLFEKGLISEQVRNRMRLMIKKRKSSASSKERNV